MEIFFISNSISNNFLVACEFEIERVQCTIIFWLAQMVNYQMIYYFNKYCDVIGMCYKRWWEILLTTLIRSIIENIDNGIGDL